MVNNKAMVCINSDVSNDADESALFIVNIKIPQNAPAIQTMS